MPWAYASTFLTGVRGACPEAPASSYRQAVGTSLRRISRGLPVVAVAILIGGCTPTAAMRPASSDTPTASPSATPSAMPSPSESPTPTPTPSGVDPGFVPALAAIQMVGLHLGWAVGAHAIFATIDGTHWTKQYASTEEFVGVDFISATTGWAVATRTLLGTTDSGRTWRQLGEPRVPLRSIHFATATQGWGIAGGSDPQQSHGWLLPHDGATLVFTYDGGLTWSTLDGPTNPQTVCFSDPAQGWIGTPEGVYIYRNTDLGHNWSKVLQRPDPQPALPQATLIQCAAPRALWVLFLGGPSGMSHSPYIAYATLDGSTWKAVLKESMSEGQILPGVPAGPDRSRRHVPGAPAPRRHRQPRAPPAHATTCLSARDETPAARTVAHPAPDARRWCRIRQWPVPLAESSRCRASARDAN